MDAIDIGNLCRLNYPCQKHLIYTLLLVRDMRLLAPTTVKGVPQDAAEFRSLFALVRKEILPAVFFTSSSKAVEGEIKKKKKNWHVMSFEAVQLAK